MLNIKNKKAFTLIEIVVSITIFSIIILSIVSIYIVSSEVTLKSDINRMMQENIKNVIEKIAEDVRKNGIEGVSSDSTCQGSTINDYTEGLKLCTKSGNKYYLAKLNISTGEYIRTNPSNCELITDKCSIAIGLNKPLTNSYVSIKSLNFSLSKAPVSKVTINIVMQPSIQKGVKPNLIKDSKLIFQTTISERPF